MKKPRKIIRIAGDYVSIVKNENKVLKLLDKIKEKDQEIMENYDNMYITNRKRRLFASELFAQKREFIAKLNEMRYFY